MLLLTAGCDVTGGDDKHQIECSTDDPDTEGTSSDTDEDGDGIVDCEDADSTASGEVKDGGLGGSITAEVIVNGDDAESEVAASHTTCYGGVDFDPTATLLGSGIQIDIDCAGNTGSSDLHASWVITKNAEAPIELVNADAAIGCDGSISAEPPWICQDVLGGVRFGCSINYNGVDVVPLDPEDTVESVFTFDVHNSLGGSGGGSIETSAGGTAYLGINPVPCPGEDECQTPQDCSDTEEEECLDNECVAPAFATGLNAELVTNPTPLDSGQTFSVTAHVSGTDDDLLPSQIVVSVSSDALDLNGSLPPGTVAGGCDVGGFSVPLVGGQNPGEMFGDINHNATFDPDADASIDYGDDGNGDFVATISMPSSGRFTVPADVDISCTLNSFFISGADGVYPVHVEATSVTTAGAAAQRASITEPLTFTDDFDFVVGEPPPLACGDPAFVAGTLGESPPDRLITASDALFVLRTAVGSETCQLCVCDVDDSGTVAASDALVTLKAAVGQQVTLSCPVCS